MSSDRPLQADEVARYLAGHPDFFERHPQLLADLALPDPHNGQAISLAERQSLILRGRIQSLEARLAQMVRHGSENDSIADRMVQWARALLSEDDAASLPAVALERLRLLFAVPFAGMRLWNLRPEHARLAVAAPVSDDIRRLAASMVAPYCGANVGFEPVRWLEAGEATVHSLAMMPLRAGGAAEVFGLLVLGSPDKERFHLTMGTAFLTRLGELAGAALSRLRAP